MKILGLETSCDETGAAIVKDGKEILSSVVTSSESLHQRFGGIIPEQAAREQLKFLIPVLDQTLKEASLPVTQIDAIAVTYGPGLIGSLIIGVETAKTLSFALKKPLIPVNHILSHIYANCLEQKAKIPFPVLALVASGGHTDLFLMQTHGKLKPLGMTRDDAAGECFDKTARLLGLGYPGGPAIEKISAQINSHVSINKNSFRLPRPMTNEDNFDFSFSGLKTAVLALVKKQKFINRRLQGLIASEIQEAITDVLVKKTLKASQVFKVKAVLIGGGVAANQRLKAKFINAAAKQQLTTSQKRKLFIPKPKFCTDNAAAVAAAAFYQNQSTPWKDLKTDPSLSLKTTTS